MASHTEVKRHLKALGWNHPFSRAGDVERAVRDFQRGWALGPRLRIDGNAGPHTAAAITESMNRLHSGAPTASRHFSFSEWQCRCDGFYYDHPWTDPLMGRAFACRRIRVDRELILGLEVLRRRFYPHGMTVVSGYRCPGHNHAVGGATNSQHRYGNACDVDYISGCSTEAVAGLHEFGGIGYSASTRLVRHVDVRQVGPNTTGGTIYHPTEWPYAS